MLTVTMEDMYLAAGIGAVFVIFKICWGYYKQAITAAEAQNNYKNKAKAVEEMKSRGEHHEWLFIPQKDGTSVHVCRKTGFVPSIDGFVPLDILEKSIKLFEQQKDVQKRCDEFLENRKKELRERFGISVNNFNLLFEDILKIEHDFTALETERLQNEIKNKVEKENKKENKENLK